METQWWVQAYDWPWHIAPAFKQIALCGAFPSKPCRVWAAHAPMSVALGGGRFGFCETCRGIAGMEGT